MVVDLATAGAVLVVVCVVARWVWGRRGEQPVPHYVSEDEARENAAPLSSAIDKRSKRE
jgi:hypothetical protein